MSELAKVVIRQGGPDWRLVVERRRGGLAVLENRALAHPNGQGRKEQFYTDGKIPAEHDHSGEVGDTPVIVLDLHKTLTPSQGFLDTTQDSGLAPPFPRVREALGELSAGGCCLEIATAALGPLHSPQVLDARRKAIASWIAKWGLPISYVTGKVGYHTAYDDRMVPVPPDGDWDPVMDGVLAGLKKRYEVDEAGVWRRKDVPEAGELFQFPDPDEILGDQPRPFSTPILDVDMHRCLTQASSSTRDAEPKPGAVAAMQAIYDAGYTIHLSCAGWDPATHTPQESAQRLAGMRQWCRRWQIPWDEFVSKRHPDPSIVDDKGVVHRDWEADLPILLERLASPHPQDEVTLMRGANT